MFFFRNLDLPNSRLNRKRVVIPRKNVSMWLAGICFIWKLMEYTFKSLKLKLQQILLGKIAFKLIFYE